MICSNSALLCLKCRSLSTELKNKNRQDYEKDKLPWKKKSERKRLPTFYWEIRSDRRKSKTVIPRWLTNPSEVNLLPRSLRNPCQECDTHTCACSTFQEENKRRAKHSQMHALRYAFRERRNGWDAWINCLKTKQWTVLKGLVRA